MNNLKQIKTTVLGALFLLAGTLEYFNLLETNHPSWVTYALWGSGILFLFSPDTMIDLITKGLKKAVSGVFPKKK